MKRRLGTGGVPKVMEEVEETLVDRVLFTRAVISKEPVELGERVGNVRAVGEIGNRQSLAGVSVEEGKDALLPVRESCRGRRERRDGKSRETVSML